MPRLSDSMEEATVVQWLKADGDDVARGEELVEIETDKATVVYEAEEDGVLSIVAGEGETVALGGLIARIGAGSPAAVADRAAPAALPATARVTAVDAPPAPSAVAVTTSPRARVPASPVARRLAAGLGIDLATLVGSGPRGRVVKRDVQAAADRPVPAAVPSGPPAPAPSSPTGGPRPRSS